MIHNCIGWFTASKGMNIGIILGLLILVTVISYYASNWADKCCKYRPRRIVIQVLATPGCIILLYGMTAMSLIALPFQAISLARENRGFKNAMKSQGRYISWAELAPRIPSGTFVVEQAHLSGTRIWWTPGNIAELSPHCIPDDRDLDYLGIPPQHPFVLWFAENYSSESTGKAILTDVHFSRHDRPAGYLTTAFFKEQFPGQEVFASVLQSDFNEPAKISESVPPPAPN